jgi:hypothetical protein
MFEGSREYGRAMVVEVRPYREPENPWEEDAMDFASATVNVNVDVAAREILLEFSGVKSHPEASDSHDIRLELGKIAFVA